MKYGVAFAMRATIAKSETRSRNILRCIGLLVGKEGESSHAIDAHLRVSMKM
jgi:hypothetical protein